jgi:hypothetical protein
MVCTGLLIFLEPVLKVDGPHELLSRRQRRELMKKGVQPHEATGRTRKGGQLNSSGDNGMIREGVWPWI